MFHLLSVPLLFGLKWERSNNFKSFILCKISKSNDYVSFFASIFMLTLLSGSCLPSLPDRFDLNRPLLQRNKEKSSRIEVKSIRLSTWKPGRLGKRGNSRPVCPHLSKTPRREAKPTQAEQHLLRGRLASVHHLCLSNDLFRFLRPRIATMSGQVSRPSHGTELTTFNLKPRYNNNMATKLGSQTCRKITAI